MHGLDSLKAGAVIFQGLSFLIMHPNPKNVKKLEPHPKNQPSFTTPKLISFDLKSNFENFIPPPPLLATKSSQGPRAQPLRKATSACWCKALVVLDSWYSTQRPCPGFSFTGKMLPEFTYPVPPWGCDGPGPEKSSNPTPFCCSGYLLGSHIPLERECYTVFNRKDKNRKGC